MPEYIRNHDKYLDPPEEADHAYCDSCAEWKSVDELHKAAGALLCDECYQDYLDELDRDEP